MACTGGDARAYMFIFMFIRHILGEPAWSNMSHFLRFGAGIAVDCGPTRAADEGRGTRTLDALLGRKFLCCEVSE
jgi:hypothetical protein